MALRRVSYQGETYMVIKKQSSSEGSPLFCCEILWHPLFFREGTSSFIGQNDENLLHHMLWLQQPLNLTQFNPPQKIVEHWRIIAEVHSTCSTSTWGLDTWLWHLTCFFLSFVTSMVQAEASALFLFVFRIDCLVRINKKKHNCLIQNISFYAFLTLCLLLEGWALKSSFHCFWYLHVHAYPKVPWRGLLFYGAMCNSHLNKSFTATFRFKWLFSVL